MARTQEEYREILEQRLTEGLLGNVAKRALATLAVGAMWESIAGD